MTFRVLCVLALSVGCTKTSGPSSTAPASESANGGAAPIAAGGAPSLGTEAALTAGGAALPPASMAPLPSVPPPPPPGVKTLPEVRVTTMGLHVGGGPNDSDTKAPFLRAIEQRFPDFLKCYRLVSEPGHGGSFGVDLHILASGGHAEVQEPRSGLGDDAFKSCMVHAFTAVDFPRLKKPFVISYSLRFSVIEP